MKATIGIDFLTKTVYVDDKMVRLQLWDTAGQERFRSLIPSYINDSSVAVTCYDITSRASFDNVQSWIDQARQIRGEDLQIFLVGNKIDDAEARQVSTEEGQAKADELGVQFIETSAKVGINVKALFKNLAATLPGVDSAEAKDKAEKADEGKASGFTITPGTGPTAKPATEQASGGGKKCGCA